jgi:hypothetical protein
LVIGVLCQCDRTDWLLTRFTLCQPAQCLVPRPARRVLRALADAIASIHRKYAKFNIKGLAQCGALPFEFGGCGLKPVVDMQCNYVGGPFASAGDEERCGIGSTAKGDT